MDKRQRLQIEKIISDSPHMIEGQSLNFLDIRYVVANEKELKNLQNVIDTFRVNIRMTNLDDIKSLELIAEFYQPETRIDMRLLDDATHCYEESDEITSRLSFPIVRANFYGDLSVIRYPKENIIPYGDTIALFPEDKNTLILLAPNGKKYNYMEIYFTKRRFL